MKKIYLLATVALFSVSAFAQTSVAGKAVPLSSKPFVHVANANRTITTPDTTGIVNFVDFLPQFAPGGQLWIYGYTGGGYIYGNNKDGLNICAQGYQNLGPTPVAVSGAIVWLAKKQSDLSSSPTSKAVVKAYKIVANRAANTNGSGTFNSTLNFPGPAATVSTSVDLLFSAMDTTAWNYVAFPAIPTFTGDFAIAFDCSTLAAGDTVGLLCDGQNEAANLDYAYHFYANKWYVSDALFSPAAAPDLGSGGLDNDIALFAVLTDATGVNEFFNSMKLTTYPNPVVNNATIEYTLEKNSTNVSLVVFAPNGTKVIDNKYNTQTAGTYKVELETSKLASGNYFYQLNANGHTFTKKFVVTK